MGGMASRLECMALQLLQLGERVGVDEGAARRRTAPRRSGAAPSSGRSCAGRRCVKRTRLSSSVGLHQAEHRLRPAARRLRGWRPSRSRHRRSPARAASRATRSSGKQRRVAGHGHEVGRLAVLQPGQEAGQRAGEVGQGVGPDRHAHRFVGAEVAVGVDHHLRRPAAPGAAARASPAACRGSSAGPCRRRPCGCRGRRRGSGR